MPTRRPLEPNTATRERRSRRATRIAFGVIAVFVLTQAAWWILFEFRSINRVTAATLSGWQRDAALMSDLVALGVDAPAATDAAAVDAAADAGSAAPTRLRPLLNDPAALRTRILADFPHLAYEPAAATAPEEAGGFVVDAEHRQAFLAAQRRHLRMFAFEGPAFALVILALLLFIAGALRTERELKRRQQNFLSAVTHEFKTPISTLRLLVQTARMRSLPPEKQRDYLVRMEAELDRLERTSEQVLASARLEQSTAAPQLAAVELNHVVQGIVGKARTGLEARGALVKVDYSPEPLPVSADADALAVVLNNLLDNAVKYSPDGHKPVRVGLERRGDVIEIHVDDQGVGLKEGEERAIFDRFYRVGEELTRQSTGVGLGLHLVKSITEAMNGWVRAGANPDADTGSRFTVVLPRRLSLTPEELSRQPSAAQPQTEGLG